MMKVNFSRDGVNDTHTQASTPILFVQPGLIGAKLTLSIKPKKIKSKCLFRSKWTPKIVTKKVRILQGSFKDSECTRSDVIYGCVV